MCIDFVRRIARPCVFLYFESRVADHHYVGNAVALDDDVDWPDRWCAGAVNERCAADDEAIIRTVALGTVGCRDHLRYFVLRQRWQGD